MEVFMGAAAVAVAAVVVFIVLVHRAVSAPAPALDAAELTSFSAASYRPMARLLEESDFRFLRRQAGFHPSIEQRLRQERRHIFHLYLSRLRVDFLRLHRAARILVLNSPVDQPGLSAEMVRQGALFHWVYLRVRVMLVLHRFGLSGVDVSALLDSADWLQAQLQVLTPARAQASMA